MHMLPFMGYGVTQLTLGRQKNKKCPGCDRDIHTYTEDPSLAHANVQPAEPARCKCIPAT